MKNIRGLLTIFFLFIVIFSPLQAQYVEDAVRFSTLNLQSDARSLASANAFGATGANFIASSINPAGLALYRNSEMGGSLSFFSSNTRSSYFDELNDDQRFNFNFGSLYGLVAEPVRNFGNDAEEGFLSYTYSLGFNRTANFHKREYYEGVNIHHSMLDHFVENSNGFIPSELGLLEGMAYDVYLTDNVFQDSAYISDRYRTALSFDKESVSGQKLLQSRSQLNRGSIYDVNLSFAANYNHKLYIGATLGIPVLRYRENNEYIEENIYDTVVYYKGMTLKENVNIRGQGVFAGLGLIYRAHDYLRLGVSVRTPSFFSINESYSYFIEGRFGGEYSDTSISIPEGKFDYNLTTPLRTTFSLALIAAQNGFISVDYELVNYSTIRLSSNDYSFRTENRNLQNIYKNTGNLRLGGELVLGDFALRAGYMYYPNPLRSEYIADGVNADMDAISFGAGLRQKDYFIDISYTIYRSEYLHTPYTLTDATPYGAHIAQKNHNVNLTVGAKF